MPGNSSEIDFMNTSYFNFSMIIVNFVCILILYILVMYLFNKYMDIEEKVNSMVDYQLINDRQLKNLISDINYNDQHITQYIKAQNTQES